MTYTPSTGLPSDRTLRSMGFALPAILIVLTFLFVISVPTIVTVQQEWKVTEAIVETAEVSEQAEELTLDLLAAWDTSFYALGVWQDTSFQQIAEETQVDFRVTRTSQTLFLIEAQASLGTGGALHNSALTVRAGGFDLVPQAALTVVDGIKMATGATIYGTDAINPPDWPSSVCTGSTARHMPGILAPDASAVGYDNGAGSYGDPAFLVDATIGLATLSEPAGVPYEVLTGAADHTFTTFNGTPFEASCDPADANNWGSPNAPTGPCGDYFPIVHVQGDAVLNSGSRGQGILLVDGNLSLPGDVHFYGLIVVRGTLQLTGLSNRIRGAVYARVATFDSGGVSTNPMIYNTSCVMDRIRAAHPELGDGVRPISSRSWVDLSGTS